MTVIFWPRLNYTWIMLPMLDQKRYFPVLLLSHFRNIFFEKIPSTGTNTSIQLCFLSTLRWASIEQICNRWAIKIASVLSNSRWCLPQLSWAASKFSKMLFGVQVWIYTVCNVYPSMLPGMVLAPRGVVFHPERLFPDIWIKLQSGCILLFWYKLPQVWLCKKWWPST